MGNQCLAFIKRYFQKHPDSTMSELTQIDVHQHEETNTQVVEVADESENFHEHTEDQIISISESIDSTLNSMTDIFLYRLKTSKDFEELYRDDQINIEFKSFKLPDRNTVIQLKFEFPLQKISIQEFLNYSYLEHIEKFTTLSTNSEVQLIYASYKKIQFIDPREFLFIKMQKKLSSHKYLQVLRSVNAEQQQQTTRGFILISGFLIEELQNGQIRVQAYCEIDFKIKLPPGMIKKALSIELKRTLQQFIN